MFKIKHISETCSDPVMAICEIGRFDGPETTYGDLVFMREGIDGTKTFMNSYVLRELLLSNPNLVANTTGVVCVDINEYNKLIETNKALAEQNKELEKKVASNKKKARVDVEVVG